jgi:hypothetical protein
LSPGYGFQSRIFLASDYLTTNSQADGHLTRTSCYSHYRHKTLDLLVIAATPRFIASARTQLKIPPSTVPPLLRHVAIARTARTSFLCYCLRHYLAMDVVYNHYVATRLHATILLGRLKQVWDMLTLGKMAITQISCLGFEVLTAVVMKNSVIWDVTSCSLLKINRRFGVIHRLHLMVLYPRRQNYSDFLVNGRRHELGNLGIPWRIIVNTVEL